MHKNILVFTLALFAGITSCAFSLKVLVLQMGGYPTVGTYLVYGVMAFSFFIVLLEFFDKARHRFLIGVMIVVELVGWLLVQDGWNVKGDLEDLLAGSYLLAGLIAVIYHYMTRHEK